MLPLLRVCLTQADNLWRCIGYKIYSTKKTRVTRANIYTNSETSANSACYFRSFCHTVVSLKCTARNSITCAMIACLTDWCLSSTCYSFHTHAWLSRWRTQAQCAGFKAASDVRNTLTLSAVFGWYLSSRSSLTFAQNIDGKSLTAAIYTAAVRRDLFLRENRIISAKKTSRIAASGWCRQCLQRDCCVQTCTLSQTANEAVQPPTSAWNRFDTSLKHVYTLQPVAQPAGGNVLNVQINKLTNKQSFVIDLILVISRDHMLPTLKINKNSFLNFENFDQTCRVVYCPHSRFAARRSTWWRHKRLRMQDRSSAAWLRSFA